MHKSSDGQRRRVQICMGLLKPFKVLLLDEITVDLDVLARADLLKFLIKECEERGATIIYTTRIYMACGKLQLTIPMDKVKEITNLSLMRILDNWLGKERDEEKKRRKERKVKGHPEYEKQVEGTRVVGGDPARAAGRPLNNGWFKNDEEIVVVIAHELGHWKLNHTIYSFIVVQPSDAASGSISLMDARRLRDDSDPNDDC
ncbi:ABC transporter I family member 20 [Capsicum annuum]|uniref:ABC transporter I family member 20 n=1 Tax=Capsicum annuum TaxID=4072 RepID=A0A2G2XWT5_CAPAN|nr:ABC transporter I family member 20 [Capsicum annuum]